MKKTLNLNHDNRDAWQKGIHLFYLCWCGSGHDWEKAKHGTVDGLTQKQINQRMEM